MMRNKLLTAVGAFAAVMTYAAAAGAEAADLDAADTVGTNIVDTVTAWGPIAAGVVAAVVLVGLGFWAIPQIIKTGKLNFRAAKAGG